MVDGILLSDELRGKIKVTLRQRVSPRHVPNHIHPIEDIPYTNRLVIKNSLIKNNFIYSGKKVELAVKQIINKEQVGVFERAKNTQFDKQ